MSNNYRIKFNLTEDFTCLFIPADNDDDDGFNLIQPSLIKQLKTILDQYPDDGQILKVLC